MTLSGRPKATLPGATSVVALSGMVELKLMRIAPRSYSPSVDLRVSNVPRQDLPSSDCCALSGAAINRFDSRRTCFWRPNSAELSQPSAERTFCTELTSIFGRRHLASSGGAFLSSAADRTARSPEPVRHVLPRHTACFRRLLKRFQTRGSEFRTDFDESWLLERNGPKETNRPRDGRQEVGFVPKARQYWAFWCPAGAGEFVHQKVMAEDWSVHGPKNAS